MDFSHTCVTLGFSSVDNSFPLFVTRLMDWTDLRVVSDSPDPVRMAVTPSRTMSDFVEVDLSTPKSSPKVALVPPSKGTAVGLASLRAPQGSTVPASPLASLNTGAEQLHPRNPNGSSEEAPPSNPPPGMDASPGASGPTTVRSQCRPPVDVQVGVPQDFSQSPGNTGPIDGGQSSPSRPSGQIPASAAASCPPDRRALLITEAAAKQAFRDYGDSKFWYGSAPAKEMTIEGLQPLNTYRFSLETFTDSRTCEWVTELYTGQHVDSTNVRFVQPWEVTVAVPDMFKDRTQKMKVPNTSSVKIQCMWCNGTGRRMQMEMCQQCYGSGTESCRMCNVTNIQNCVTCAGRGQVLTYLQLTVTWKNNKYEYISDHNSEFSSDHFSAVHGERIFTDEQLSVSPLAHFPDSSIIWASQNALEQHRTQFSSTCHVLRQRQSIELLPLTKVQYTWKGNPLNYFVYGKENKVYVQNYPQKCCCAVM
ncbi:protein SSUH2 homolog isoform X2 [Bufo gargarizans]|uniref:protein SSUH2 homolog isoform X2 n=1 Tax=Bufo gargarizans TaxID=30331 RepID=UPI001CF5D686|nr:protein SSUH2 homolog isoform X2 [Bufo gargarizans]